MEHVAGSEGLLSQQEKGGMVSGGGSLEKLTSIASSLASQLAAVNSALERSMHLAGRYILT